MKTRGGLNYTADRHPPGASSVPVAKDGVRITKFEINYRTSGWTTIGSGGRLLAALQRQGSVRLEGAPHVLRQLAKSGGIPD